MLDLGPRWLIGWSMGEHHDAQLAAVQLAAALEDAMDTGGRHRM